MASIPSVQNFNHSVRGTMYDGAPAAAPLGGPGSTPGVRAEDTLLAAWSISGDLGTITDVTAEATVPATGQLELSTTDTTGAFVLAVWIAN